MKNMLIAVVAVAMMVAFNGMAQAKDVPAEVTLKGTFTCAKCDLSETKKCQNVLIVKDGDKTTNYYLVQNKLSKDNHEHVCKKSIDGVTVTGTVSEVDGKKQLLASKIELPKSG